MPRNYHLVFYVAPNGSVQNPGTKDNPFATLEHSRDAVRNAKKTTKEPITVFVRGGIYYLTEPIVFTSEDSGTKDAPITYAAYEDEIPIISGAAKLNLKWSEYKDGIMQAEIPAVKEGKLAFTQLFINGKRQHLARYPNYNDPNPLITGPGASSDALNNERVKQWANPVGALVHGLSSHRWGSLHYRITGINDKGEVQLEGGDQINRNSVLHDNFRYVENVFEELDAPNEWYLDAKQGILYYMPPEGMDLAEAKVEAVMLKQLFEFRGSMDAPVRHITLRGFTIAHTAHTFLDKYEPLLRGDWSIARAGAVFSENAEDCAIEDCFFDAMGGNGVFISKYNRRITVSGCKFTEAGDSAICLVGDVSAVHSPSTWDNHIKEPVQTPGPKNSHYPANCLIHNNLIHDIGIIGKQTAGVFISMAEEITVSHNTIYNIPRAGICINDGCWGGHIIEYNDIFSTVRETGDHGPFNSWGRDRHWGIDDQKLRKSLSRLDSYKTTIIRNNRFRHHGSHSWGIDLDDGSSNYHIYNNLCLGMSIKLREGYYRTVENNIIVGPIPFALHCWYPDSEDVITRNLIVVTGNEVYEPINMLTPTDENRWGRLIDYNLFKTSDPDKFLVKNVADSLEVWCKKGYDRHSIYGDPLFIDPDNGDFRVKANSPALELGFKNFPMTKFGVSEMKNEY
ncbi:right-handed parallel beta-helix repeat-containing protein [Candidatus Poribacteria bacterium]|nr:right-handed parallel beta-helix repeat-containing protein [Candidatus Poribacteria bacterium]